MLLSAFYFLQQINLCVPGPDQQLVDGIERVFRKGEQACCYVEMIAASTDSYSCDKRASLALDPHPKLQD